MSTEAVWMWVFAGCLAFWLLVAYAIERVVL